MTETARLTAYRHYKGGTYTLLYVARSSEKRNELLAVYVSHQTQVVWVRPWAMFNEVVMWPDGTPRPRFCEMPRDVSVAMNEVPTTEPESPSGEPGGPPAT